MALLLSVLFASFFGQAIDGIFLNSGYQTAVQEKIVKVVPRVSESNLETISQLQSQGYRCRTVGRFSKCYDFVNSASLPQQTLTPNYQEIIVPVAETKEIVAEGEGVIQYKTNQKVMVDDQEYLGALYTETDQIQKVEFGIDSGKSIYFIIDKFGIHELRVQRENQSKNDWTEFMYTDEYLAL